MGIRTEKVAAQTEAILPPPPRVTSMTVPHGVIGPVTAMAQPRAHWPAVLHAPVTGSAFFEAFAGAGGGLAHQILAAFSERDYDAAEASVFQILSHLPPGDATTPELLLAAAGHLPGPVNWGADACVDALRLRRLARGTGALNVPPDSVPPFTGILRWLGQRVDPQTLTSTDLSPRTVRVLVAAIASAHGYARALECARRIPRDRQTPSLAWWMAVLALRAVIEGGALAPAAEWLLPPLHDRPGLPWRGGPAAIVLQEAVRQRDTFTAVLIVSGLVQALFVRRFSEAARRVGFVGGTREARRLFTTPEGYRVLRGLVDRLGVDGWHPWTSPASRTAGASLGISLLRTHQLFQRRTNRSPQVLWPLYLDRTLGSAVLFSALGECEQAEACLGSTPTGASPWDEARAAIRQTLRTLPAEPDAFWSLIGSLPEDLQRLEALVRDLPEPSIATGTPLWSLAADRGALSVRFAAEGRLGDYRRIRTLLDRPDTVTAIRPYWLLRNSDRRAFSEAIRGASRFLPFPSPLMWIRFLDARVPSADRVNQHA